MIAFVAYVACIVLANVMISVFGLWPVGFGLLAPAGVYMAGLSFSARDWLQESGGRTVTVLAILLGAGISALLSPGLAVASGVAFLLSESLDMLVYTPLKRRGLMRAVVASNIVGAVVDSCVFLALAFGSLEFLPGLLVGKAWTVLAAVAVLVVVRQRRREVVTA